MVMVAEGRAVPAQCWTLKELRLHITDACDHRSALLKQLLRENYQLPDTEAFSCIMHFLNTLKRTSHLTSSISMEYLCRNLNKHTGHISKLFAILTSSSTKLLYMENGNKTEEWSKLAQYVSKTYINTSLIEASYKVLYRWYLVPVRVASSVLWASPLCFRGCGLEGTVFHTWWSCPKVKKFWIRTYNFMHSLTQANLIKSQQAILGSPVEGSNEWTNCIYL